MKPREPRREVQIDARLRQDSGWSNARIINLSGHGLCARSPQVPPRGAYVEVCKGTHRIVARVVWAKDGRFGLRAQDAIAVEALVRGVEPPLPIAANANNDRRLPAREESAEERQERSRRWSRRAEFVAVTAFAFAAAAIAFDTVRDTLARPLRQVEASLARRT